MPARTTKSASRPVKKLARSSKSGPKSAQPPKPSRPRRSTGKAADANSETPHKLQRVKVAAFPPESISVLERRICLACVLDIFTRHLGLSSRAAHLEIRKYVPSLAELYAPGMTRPWFIDHSNQNPCPYCGAAAKWHTSIQVYRIESGKATDALRRELIKSLPKSDNQFEVLEEKVTQQHAFFEWLEKISVGLDLDHPTWLHEVSRHYLSRKEPKTDWHAMFGQVHAIRRSRCLEIGWELDTGRLFLAPVLFDEILLVQYLVSRSHRAGGLTLEGRFTLPELLSRLRNSGYLRAVGVSAQNAVDALERLVSHLGGGESAIRFYHIVDRRDFVEKMKSVRLLRPPKPKAPLTRR